MKATRNVFKFVGSHHIHFNRFSTSKFSSSKFAIRPCLAAVFLVDTLVLYQLKQLHENTPYSRLAAQILGVYT
jgi:hypothetical protein